MPYLQLDNITKRFQGYTALGGISLTLRQGEFVTILGPSGCGKTTLLNILSGILMPDTGRLLLEDADITKRPPEKRNFGMVFQNYALFPNLTVAANIGYGLHALPKTQAQTRIRDLVELTGLGGLEQRFPAELSGGQKQRTALARALATNPAVLLLDEPLSALDAQVRTALGQELLRLQRETGITTVMVTHDQQEALSLSDRIVLMNGGRIIQDGSPETLYESPGTPFAAEFVGHINIFSMPQLNNGQATGIRFEDVQVALPSERILEQQNTWVGRVEHIALMGAFHRVEILLNDFRTRLYADMPRTASGPRLSRRALVAVTLPGNCLRLWDMP